jgi:hypothetical protein
VRRARRARFPEHPHGSHPDGLAHLLVASAMRTGVGAREGRGVRVKNGRAKAPSCSGRMVWKDDSGLRLGLSLESFLSVSLVVVS